jgi:hypothetical protein
MSKDFSAVFAAVGLAASGVAVGWGGVSPVTAYEQAGIFGAAPTPNPASR